MKSIMAVLALLTLLSGTAAAEDRWVIGYGAGGKHWAIERSAPPNQSEINEQTQRAYQERKRKRDEAKIQKRRQEEAAAKLASQKRQRELDKSYRESQLFMLQQERDARQIERDQRRQDPGGGTQGAGVLSTWFLGGKAAIF